LSLDLFIQGMIAGYGIAVPIGPIAILIIELGVRRGFSVAFCGGAGAASADLVYATLASLAGTFLVAVLKPFSHTIHTLGALALIAIGLWLLYSGRGKGTQRRDELRVSTRRAAYLFIFGLTLLNPLTVVYFTTLILGLRSNIAASPEAAVSFVFGAFLASLSWQSVVACIGGFGHKHLSPKIRLITFAIGNSIIVMIGLLLLLGFSI